MGLLKDKETIADLEHRLEVQVRANAALTRELERVKAELARATKRPIRRAGW